MKRSKIMVGVVFAIVCGVFFINITHATTYKSSLSLDTATLKGATRYYSAGENKFSIKPTKLTQQEAGEYVQLMVQLTEDNGNYTKVIGTRYLDLYKAAVNQTHSTSFGYQNAGKRYYYFSTKHNNIDWGYVYAKKGNVIMSS